VIEQILFAMWFFGPAGLANAAPIIANNTPIIKDFNRPMDLGKTFRGVRVLGDNKTFRGLLSGMIMGLIVASVQMILFSQFTSIDSFTMDIDYSSPIVLLMGISMGFGVLLGDAVESFFKRQAGVAPGKSWVPFDQIDFIAGGLVFSLPFARLDARTYATTLIVMALLHPAVNLLGWALGFKSKPF